MVCQAYSIGTASRGLTYKNNTPGPGAYTYDKKQKKQPPKWKIGTENRNIFKKNDTPGVGSYHMRLKNEGPQYTCRPKTPVKTETTITPGSGTYDPRIYSQYKKSVSYTMGLKTSLSTSKLKVPGPGTYENKSTVIDRPTYVFGRDTNRDFYQNNKNPGPGTYKPSHHQGERPDSAQGPKWGFGTFVRKMFGGDEKVPGPGSYEYKGAMNSYYSENSVGKTMVGRKLVYPDQKVPGAGSYNPNFSQTKIQNPQYRIGSAERKQWIDNRVPGVGTYNISFYDRPSTPSAKVGTDIRRPLGHDSKSPGVGTYEMYTKTQAPLYSFKGVNRTDPIQTERMKVPEGGRYNPSHFLTKERPSSAKIGTGQRTVENNRVTTGPGDYEVRNKPGEQIPKWGFGSELQRPSSSKLTAPGPGTYSLKPTFANVPKYLIPNSQSQAYLPSQYV